MMIEAPDIGTRKVACCYPESNCWDCHWHHWPRPTWRTASPRGRGWSPPSAGRTSCWTRRGGSSSAGRWWARPAGCSPSAPASAARRSPSWTRCPSCCCSSCTHSWLQTPGCVWWRRNVIWYDWIMLCWAAAALCEVFTALHLHSQDTGRIMGLLHFTRLLLATFCFELVWHTFSTSEINLQYQF